MKTKLYLLFAILFIVSCNNNDELSDLSTQTDDKELDFKWDEVYRYNFNSKDDVPLDLPEFQAKTRAQTIQIGEETIYPSQNIVLSQFLQTGRWNEIFCKKVLTL